MSDEISTLAMKLIETQRTLVLATVDPEPWCAPVYYLYLHRRFYFFSSPKSRHSLALRSTSRGAASIFRDGDHWREIEGLQMDGTVEVIPVGNEAVEAFSGYLKKFPTVRDFFDNEGFGFEQFTQRFRTQLYALVPESLFYLNNQAGLDKRREIQLPA